MSDFTTDLVGAKRINVVDEKGNVIRTESIEGKPAPQKKETPTKPRSITLRFVIWALIGEIIAIGAIVYYVLSGVIAPSIPASYIGIPIAVIALVAAALVWHGINGLKAWSWKIAIIILIIGMPVSFLLLSLATAGLLIYDVLVLYYLTRKETKKYFGV